MRARYATDSASSERMGLSMMKQKSTCKHAATVALAMALSLGTIGYVSGCSFSFGSQPAGDTEEEPFDDSELADGIYEIEAETDSSMFRSEACLLKVQDGEYTAILSLPGEGFSRLYFGSAEDAVEASLTEIYDYSINDDGLYTFELPVEELDKELDIACYGQRRDTWYDHTIIFHEPTGKPVADVE